MKTWSKASGRAGNTLILLLAGAGALGAASSPFATPAELAGTIHESASGTNRVLFTFRRTVVRSNDSLHVTRDFHYPNGALAARETVLFARDQLARFVLEEKQTGAQGVAEVTPSGARGGKSAIRFTWSDGRRTTTDSETVAGEIVVGDMLPYFIQAHWERLARGGEVPLRFIVPSRLETVGFKLVREADVTWRGQAACRIRMEPSSIVIRQLVDPLYFTVSRDGGKKLFEYVGRTTPKRRDGGIWKDLDARTIYDWP